MWWPRRPPRLSGSRVRVVGLAAGAVIVVHSLLVRTVDSVDLALHLVFRAALGFPQLPLYLIRIERIRPAAPCFVCDGAGCMILLEVVK
jgi:hypothetical protein